MRRVRTQRDRDLARHYKQAERERKRQKLGASGRVCSEPGCITQLSTYNETERCWAHQPAVYGGIRVEQASSKEPQVVYLDELGESWPRECPMCPYICPNSSSLRSHLWHRHDAVLGVLGV